VVFADLLVGSNRTNSVLRFDENTGELIDAFVPEGSKELAQPAGLTFGPDGKLYVASHGPNPVLQ
jgi:DNA-binding beta-propeller fold protein YncE